MRARILAGAFAAAALMTPTSAQAAMPVIVQDNAILLREKGATRAQLFNYSRSELGATGIQVDAFYCDWRRSPQPVIDAVAAATAYGFTVRVRVSPSPMWCSQTDALNATNYSPRAMRSFAAEVARTLSPWSVRRYSIGNEPNHPLFSVSKSPVKYRALYLAGSRGIRSVVPRPVIFMGDTAAGGSSIAKWYRGMGSMRWHGGTLDGLAHHPYERGVDPLAPPGRNASAGWRISRIDRCVTFARRVFKTGCHVTEFGYKATEPRQKWLLRRAIAHAERQGVRSFTVYQVLRQPDEKWNTGLEDSLAGW